MKKLILVAVAILGTVGVSHAGVHFSFGINIPGPAPVVVAPGGYYAAPAYPAPPVYYAPPPPPVYYAPLPPPVYYAPPRAVYAPAPPMIHFGFGGGHGYGRHYGGGRGGGHCR